MSIWHSLQFESDKRKEEVFKILLSNDVGLKEYSDGFETDGVYGRVSELSKYSQEGMEEAYNFRPNLRITFNEDSDGDVEKVYKVVGRAVASILQQEKGDAIFFYVADTPILRRTKGRTDVTNRSEFDWLRNALDEAGLKYELKSVDEISSVPA